MYSIQEPNNKISSKTVKVYRMTNIIIDAITIILLGILLWAGYYFAWYRWVKVMLWGFIGLTPFLVIWSVIINPIIIQNYWRYGIDENFVRLRHGKFNQIDTIIPMTKIQYVEAEQGPILRRFGLYSLTIGTMGSSHEIPALPKHEAFYIRDQIAYHARINEEDETNES